MSKAECQALALYQQCFSNYYIYKQPYEWDTKRKRIVKVNRSWEVWIHRLHLPTIMTVSGLMGAFYVTRHKRLHPTESELTDLAEFLLHLFVATCFAYIPLYEGVFHVYDGDLFPGINRLLVFNRNISMATYSECN
jgi:hypothetical protein